MLVTRSCSRPAGNANRDDAGSNGLKTAWSQHNSGGDHNVQAQAAWRLLRTTGMRQLTKENSCPRKPSHSIGVISAVRRTCCQHQPAQPTEGPTEWSPEADRLLGSPRSAVSSCWSLPSRAGVWLCPGISPCAASMALSKARCCLLRLSSDEEACWLDCCRSNSLQAEPGDSRCK